MDAEEFKQAYQRGRRDFKRVDLSDTDLSHGSFPEVRLQEAHLDRANLTGCDLHYADLEGAILDRSVLRRAKLRSANLGSTSLANVDAVEAVLTRAHLEQARAQGAQFLEADLRAANLTAANFADANFSGAVLRSATLDDVNFTNADLSACSLRYAIGTPRSVLGCRITSGTCELSAWNRASITYWTQHGAQLTRWGLPDDNFLSSTDEGQRRKELQRLLISMFRADDLKIYVGTNLPDIEAKLPAYTQDLGTVVWELVVVLEKRGLINDKLFCSLQNEAPMRKSEIMAVARLWLVDA